MRALRDGRSGALTPRLRPLAISRRRALAWGAGGSIMPAVKTFVVTNQKGGVGKTTTAANLGAAIAARGKGVCLIDLDPQSHLTLHFGVEPGAPAESVYHVLTENAPISRVAMLLAPNLWLAPSQIDLAAAEVELVGEVGREQILRDRLAEHDLPCEIVMIDCPPSLGLLTLNALAAADEVIIPLQPHFLALQGLGKLLETVLLVQRRINPNLCVSGVILCMYETHTRLAAEVVADLRRFLDESRTRNVPWANARIFETIIRRNIKLAECPSHGKTIFEYDPNCIGAQDYSALVDEFISFHGLEEQSPGEREEQERSGVTDAQTPDDRTSTGAAQTQAPGACDRQEEAHVETPAPRAPMQPPTHTTDTAAPGADPPTQT